MAGGGRRCGAASLSLLLFFPVRVAREADTVPIRDVPSVQIGLPRTRVIFLKDHRGTLSANSTMTRTRISPPSSRAGVTHM